MHFIYCLSCYIRINAKKSYPTVNLDMAVVKSISFLNIKLLIMWKSFVFDNAAVVTNIHWNSLHCIIRQVCGFMCSPQLHHISNEPVKIVLVQSHTFNGVTSNSIHLKNAFGFFEKNMACCTLRGD